MIDQSGNATVVVFGRGDIGVRSGKHDTTNYPFVSFKECETAEIGEKLGKTIQGSSIVKFVFLNKEALDVVLAQLTLAREHFDEKIHDKSQAY